MIKIFSHGSDIDGLGNIILGKIAFGEIEYELFPDPQNLRDVFKKYIEDGSLHDYEKIYITDLALYDPSLHMVNDDLKLKNKILIFDHHKGAIDAHCDRYDFTTVKITDETGKKKCGTELFYEYLYKNNYIERTVALDSFVELVRLEDTWDWTKKGDEGLLAHDLALLFNSITREEYITRMILKITKCSDLPFSFDTYEKELIANKKEECDMAIFDALNQMEYFTDELNNKFGTVFTKYEFRNEIPEYIRKSGNPENIMYVVICAMDKGENGQKSYRVVKDGFDVNEIAKLHGGGGHVSAAAVAITAEQKQKALSLPKRAGLKYLTDCIYE